MAEDAKHASAAVLGGEYVAARHDGLPPSASAILAFSLPQNIKEVLLFPAMKPEDHRPGAGEAHIDQDLQRLGIHN